MPKWWIKPKRCLGKQQFYDHPRIYQKKKKIGQKFTKTDILPEVIMDELVYVPETTHKILENSWKKAPMKKKLNLSKIFSNSSSSKSLKAKLFGMPNFTDNLFKAPPSTSR